MVHFMLYIFYNLKKFESQKETNIGRKSMGKFLGQGVLHKGKGDGAGCVSGCVVPFGVEVSGKRTQPLETDLFS